MSCACFIMLICSLRRLKSPRCLAVNEEKRSALAAACNQMVIGLRSGELELSVLCEDEDYPVCL